MTYVKYRIIDQYAIQLYRDLTASIHLTIYTCTTCLHLKVFFRTSVRGSEAYIIFSTFSYIVIICSGFLIYSDLTGSVRQSLLPFYSCMSSVGCINRWTYSRTHKLANPRYSYQAVALPPLLDVPHTRMSDACFVVYHDWMTALRPGNNVALLLCSW